MLYPPHIQAMLDQGLAYETMDGCVQMCDAYLRGGYGLPTINIQINNTYNTYNTYNGNVNNGNAAIDSNLNIGQIIE